MEFKEFKNEIGKILKEYWITSAEWDALDKTTVQEGDIYHIVGLIEKDDLSLELKNEFENNAKTNSSNTFTASQIFNDIFVNGDIIHNGASYSTHAEKLYTKKDFIILRDGSTTALGSGNAGLVALNYADKNGFKNGGLVYDGNGYARVGDISFTYTALETKPTYANAIGLYYLSNGNYIEITQSSVSETQYGNITAVYEQHIDASQAQTIATRLDDNLLNDQHFLIWNDAGKCLEDSGKAIEDFVAAKKAYPNPSAMPNDTLSLKAYCTTTQKDASGNVTENPFDVCSISASGANAAIARYDGNGQLTVTKDPTADNHLARKAFVESKTNAIKLYKHQISATDPDAPYGLTLTLLSHKSTAYSNATELVSTNLEDWGRILYAYFDGKYSLGNVNATVSANGITLSAFFFRYGVSGSNETLPIHSGLTHFSDVVTEF